MRLVASFNFFGTDRDWTAWVLFLGCVLILAVPAAAQSGPTGTAVEPARQSLNPREPYSAAASGSKPLTLAECVRIALQHNPAVLAEQWDVRAAADDRRLTAAQRLPNLNLKGVYNHALDPLRLVPASYNGEKGVFSRDLSSADLVLSLPLFTGGRLTNQVRATELIEQATGHGLARTEEEVVFNVSSVFYSMLQQHKVIQAFKFSREVLEKHLDRVQDLIAAEKAAKIDRMRTEVRIANLEEELLKERNRLAVLKRVLVNLLGMEAQVEDIEIQGDLTLPVDHPEEGAAVAGALKRRPDYLALAARVEAQEKQWRAAQGERLPQLSLQASYGGRWAANVTDDAPGTDPSEAVGRIGLQLEIPVYRGGGLLARVRRERNRLEAARERLRKLQLQVALDIQSAALDVSSARKRIQTQKTNVDKATEALRIETEKDALGKGSIVEVLDAQGDLLTAQTSYYRARADYHIAVAKFHLAMGDPS